MRYISIIALVLLLMIGGIACMQLNLEANDNTILKLEKRITWLEQQIGKPGVSLRREEFQR